MPTAAAHAVCDGQASVLAYSPAQGHSALATERSLLMDVIEAIRDILISVYLIAGIVLTVGLLVFAFLLFLAVRALIRAATRGVENFSKVSDAAVEHIVKPLEEGMSIGSVAGNALGFTTGFIAGLRGRGKRDKRDRDDGKGDKDDGKRKGKR